MTPPDVGTDPSEPRDDPVDRILLACLRRADRFTAAEVRRLTRAHPEHADAIRSRIEAVHRRSMPHAGGALDSNATPAGSTPLAATHTYADDRLEPIGHYRLLEELGRGGQAVVYLAEDTRLHRKVALKVLIGFGALSAQARERFQREAEVASRLDHPGLCRVFEAGVVDDVPYIAFRYVAGEPLGKKIAAARASRSAEAPTARSDADPVSSVLSSGGTARGAIREMVELIEKAARALHAAHESGVVHRDVKPGNLMIAPEGDPVVMDFGLARGLAEDAETFTRSDDRFGTPAYMSPEQIALGRAPVDRRTDVWGLGVTLYECLTLRRPFEAPTRVALVQAILDEDPPLPRTRNPRLPRDLEVVVEKCLEKDADRRYSTALDVAEELRRVREGTPIQARPVGPIGRTLRWIRRRPARAALFAAVAIGLPALAALGTYAAVKWPMYAAHWREELRAKVEPILQDGYLQLGHDAPATALASFDRALALEPGNVEAVAGRAMALLEDRKFEACLEYLDRHAALAGQVRALLHVKVDALKALQRAREAGALERSIPEPETPLDFFLAGSSLMRGCKWRALEPRVFRRALDCFLQAAFRSERPRALYHIEVAHAAGHARDREIGRLASDILTSSWAESFGAVFMAAFAVGAGDPARRDPDGRLFRLIQRSVEMNERHIEGWVNLSYQYIHQSRKIADPGRPWTELPPRARALIEKAREAADRALALDPTHSGALTSAAGVLTRQGRLEEALALHSKAVAHHPDFAPGWCNIGYLLGRLGRLEEALDPCRKSVKLDPDLPDPQNIWGNVLTALGRYEEAAPHYERAIELRPDWEHPRNNLKSVRMTLRLRSLLRRDDPPPRIERLLSAFDEGRKLGHFHVAVDLWKAAFARDPSRTLELSLGSPYSAAHTAILASASMRGDCWCLDTAARAVHRAQALAWLEETVQTWTWRHEAGLVRPTVLRSNLELLAETDRSLRTVQDASRLKELPEREQAAWRAFWKRVNDLRARL